MKQLSSLLAHLSWDQRLTLIASVLVPFYLMLPVYATLQADGAGLLVTGIVLPLAFGIGLFYCLLGCGLSQLCILTVWLFTQARRQGGRAGTAICHVVVVARDALSERLRPFLVGNLARRTLAYLLATSHSPADFPYLLYPLSCILRN